eukprot:TRINITY_DN5611_c0_g1_i1.p1 TRINITY_DN5611_c0_g1~~TRINITY_DN5611_c0_g1_i1.p1  ORF type:complete len:232 (-),score=25.20 TRINITY_DN5611_c0_g1_i1:48-743(-)
MDLLELTWSVPECSLLEALIRWGYHGLPNTDQEGNYQQIKNKLEPLMPLVRFTDIPSNELFSIPHMRQIVPKRALTEAFHWQVDPQGCYKHWLVSPYMSNLMPRRASFEFEIKVGYTDLRTKHKRIRSTEINAFGLQWYTEVSLFYERNTTDLMTSVYLKRQPLHKVQVCCSISTSDINFSLDTIYEKNNAHGWGKRKVEMSCTPFGTFSVFVTVNFLSFPEILELEDETI